MTEALPGLHHLRAHPGGPRGQRVIGSSVSWSGGSGLAELSVRLDLGMDFRGRAFSLSVVIVIGGGMTPTSASGAKETTRARLSEAGPTSVVVLHGRGITILD